MTPSFGAYRELRERDRVRPAEPIEAFVAFVVRSGSASAALNMLMAMKRVEAEGFEAYARVCSTGIKAAESGFTSPTKTRRQWSTCS